MKNLKIRGITLISLVLTIIVLLILASITIMTLTQENGIFIKSNEAKEEQNRQTATEKVNLKITASQIDVYGKEQRMPTLKELSLYFKEDEEIAYVTETSKVASAQYDVTSDNPTTIYTKLKEYPYEFEINSLLQLASIDGKPINRNDTTSNNSDDINELKETIAQMQTTINSLDSRITNLNSMYDKIKIKNYKAGTANIPACPSNTRVFASVSFSEPFQDTNYAVSIVSTYDADWWAQSSYTVTNKTANGFTIWCFNEGSGATIAHPIDWLAVSKTQ